jgi:WD40 repeat protein
MASGQFFAAWVSLALLATTTCAFAPDRELPPAPDDRLGHVRLLGEHLNFLTARFSPDGRLAVSSGGGELTLGVGGQWIAGTDFDVRVWDVKSGRLLHRLAHAEHVFAAFAPNNQQVLTTSGKSVRVWSIHTGKLLRQHDYPFPVGWAAWNRDGKTWFIGCGDRNVRLFDADTGKILRTFAGHTDPRIESVAIAPDRKRALSSGFDGTVRIWNLETGQQMRVIVANSGMRVRQAVWAANDQVLSAGADNLVHLWDVQKGQELRRYNGHSHYVESVSCSPDGIRLLSASLDGTIRLWNVNTGKELHRFDNFHVPGRHRTVVHIDFAPDGRYALSSGWDKTLRLWRLPD